MLNLGFRNACRLFSRLSVLSTQSSVLVCEPDRPSSRRRFVTGIRNLDGAQSITTRDRHRAAAAKRSDERAQHVDHSGTWLNVLLQYAPARLEPGDAMMDPIHPELPGCPDPVRAADTSPADA